MYIYIYIYIYIVAGPLGHLQPQPENTLSVFRAERSMYPGDLRNVPAADNLRRHTTSPTGHNVACLITDRTHAGGVSRMGNVTALADLFVCADPEDHGTMRFANFSNLVSYGTSDEDGSYPVGLRGVDSTLAKWWRLQQCWKRVQDFEEHHGFRYSFYMKTQTGCALYHACYPCLGTYQAGLHKAMSIYKTAHTSCHKK